MTDPVSNTPPPGGDLLARARAALEGVSPGPWEMRDGYVYPLSISARLGGIWPADAEFICASRDLVPDLVIDLATTKALLDTTREQLSEYVALFVAMRDALGREKAREIIESVTGAHDDE